MPDSQYLTFTDPDEYQAAIRAGTVKLVISAAGSFRSELTRIDLHRLWMQRGWESLPRVASLQIDRSRRPITFLPDPDSPPFLQGGASLSADEIVFHAAGEVHYHRTHRASGWAAMSLTPEDLSEAGRLAGCELTPPAAARFIRPPPHLLSRLRSLHAAAVDLAKTVPDILACPEVARAIEQELIRAMVACLRSGIAVDQGGARDIRVPVMRRFARLLEDNPDRPLYITEICQAIGVADRTLRLRCMEELGMSPHRYLWLRRMNQARRALVRADPAQASVTELATDHGFGELGRFAVAYRRLFGESPSATLRRPVDDPPPSLTERTNGRFPILP